MAQDAVALNGLNGDRHRQFRRSVIPILMYNREGENPNKPISVISGIVTVSGGGFCHIIAYKGLLFPPEAHKYRYEIVFPNDMRVDLEHLGVERHGLLAGFYCHVPVEIVDAVHFGIQTTRNQELKMYGYQVDNVSGRLQNDLTDGYLTHVEEQYQEFRHDCTPSFFSRRGSPVFNEQRQLVGISFKDIGVTKALDIGYITAILPRFCGGDDNMPMSDVLERIRLLGEQKFAMPEDLEPSPSP
ncbi:uncharacterized protein LOC125547874 isoform X1 [Triticum urartu]|uniref:Uncharacterized protein n=1 Tax=Triticum urartu TaxID=4572 RepID=A0A8R7TS79_TRIUA|nr:uncharacterized protein LOC125547872 isoform X1 [Triticum urartu]XP_048567573.1 uncharacterized protein LOC125547874 isoform X1 [Triticum urartu]